MKDKWINVAIVVLVVVAAGLGYLIYSNSASSSSTSVADRFTGLTDSVSDSISSSEKGEKDTENELTVMEKKNLSAEEKDVIAHPGPDATSQELDDHAKLVDKLAEEADFLDISECQPRPVVMKVKKGADFTVRNTDITANAIVIDADHIFEIPASSEIAVTADFGRGGGIYGYGCGNSTEAVGMFLVTDE